MRGLTNHTGIKRQRSPNSHASVSRQWFRKGLLPKGLKGIDGERAVALVLSAKRGGNRALWAKALGFGMAYQGCCRSGFLRWHGLLQGLKMGQEHISLDTAPEELVQSGSVSDMPHESVPESQIEAEMPVCQPGVGFTRPAFLVPWAAHTC